MNSPRAMSYLFLLKLMWCHSQDLIPPQNPCLQLSHWSWQLVKDSFLDKGPLWCPFAHNVTGTMEWCSSIHPKLYVSNITNCVPFHQDFPHSTQLTSIRKNQWGEQELSHQSLPAVTLSFPAVTLSLAKPKLYNISEIGRKQTTTQVFQMLNCGFHLSSLHAIFPLVFCFYFIFNGKYILKTNKTFFAFKCLNS